MLAPIKKKLSEHPEKERALWRAFEHLTFEHQIIDFHQLTPIGSLISWTIRDYFDLVGRPLPDSRTGILQSLANDALIQKDVAGFWSITNLGAALFAKRLDEFGSIRRKAC